MKTANPQPHYESLECRARPARIAILADSSDIDWRHNAVRIIEILTSIWGGKHSIIVPTDGLTIEPAFWAVLERFSPDFLYVYAKTGADIKISHPAKYAALLQQRIEQVEQYASVITLEGERERIDKELQNAWVGPGFDLDADLRSQLGNRLVPFHFERNIDRVTSQYIPPRLTRIVDVVPYIDHPESFSSFGVPPEVDALWWMGHTGAYSAVVSGQLLAAGLAEDKFNVLPHQLSGFAAWIADGAVSAVRSEINERSGAGFVPPDPTQPTPFELSISCVGYYGSLASRRVFSDRFALVLGDSFRDFCLSYCLPRIGCRAFWMPSAWLDELQSQKNDSLRACILSVVYAVPLDVRRGAGLKVSSLSRETAYVAEAIDTIRTYAGFGLNGEKCSAVEPMDIVTEPIEALTPYCLDSPNHSEMYPFLMDRSVGPIRSAKPSGFSKLSALKHRWVTEVIARSRAVPTIPHIAERLVVSPQALGTYGARMSQGALAYDCPGSFLVVGEDMGAHLVNPEVRLFDTFTAVSFVADANGYSCQLSDKGIYQRDSFEKLGGVSKVCELLKNDGSRAVFDKFLDHTKRSTGTYDEGCVLEKRTYLDLRATQKLMGDDENAAVGLLDKLTAAQVLYRGFALGCAVCKHAAWYSLADLTDEFRCMRCGREQTISHQHWKQPAAPQIFYKLDEIVYQFLKNDGDVVALSLGYMSGKSKYPFNYSPEIEFRESTSTSPLEIDLCAVYDGVLAIGEAKKQGKLASSNSETLKVIDKYVRLATILNARRVLFCTTSPKWEDSTVETVRHAFQGELAAPTFLTAEELLGKSPSHS